MPRIHCNLSPNVLSRINGRLRDAFGQRLRGVILYGSEARGEADKDSDVDLLVLLAGPVDEGKDSWACIRALYPMILELERPIHAKPTDIRLFENEDLPFYRNVKREGIMV